jgi:hypothetical protein
MSEAAILSAFWMPGQRRFCELTGAEVEARSGADLKSPDFQSLRVRRIILATNGSEAQHKMTVYRLAGEGERRVSAMVVMGILPKPRHRLTATPREGVRNRA